MTLVTVEGTWLRWLLEDFGVFVSMPTHLLFYSTWDPITHELTKYISVDDYFT
jgi:hypothetical protein